jgi:glycosyltransferase involved in cell wall biosynthesis
MNKPQTLNPASGEMMPKLLIVANVPSMLREFLLPYAEHFAELGWQVDGMVSEATTVADTGEELKVYGTIHRVAWSRNPLDPRNFLQAPQTIREVVSKEKYDIVHVHSPIAAFVTRYALRNMRNRPAVIYTAHGFHFHRGGGAVKNRIFLTLEQVAGPWTDYLVVMNHEDEQAVKKYKIVPENKLLYMPGIGVDIKLYSPERATEENVQKVRAELGLNDKERFLFMIAEFNPGKRHRDALAAFAHLNRSDVLLVFAGVGPLEEEIKALATQLGVAERVRFLGYRRDIPVLLKAATALLLPSEREGLPRAILEALCMGTPVISTQIRGVEDLLANNCGLMTPVGDAPALKNAMAHLLDNPEEASAMAKRGLDHVKLFDLANVIRLHDELYAMADFKKACPERNRRVD